MIDEAFGNWLAGLIDGEGCFSIDRMTDNYACAFAIVLRDDDSPILNEIQRRTGLGVLRRRRSVRALGWYVGRKHECQGLAQLLDAHPLRAKKARDFAIWKEALDAWATTWYGRNNEAAYERMAHLKARLQSGRAYEPWPIVEESASQLCLPMGL